jgi:hypothetical protein
VDDTQVTADALGSVRDLARSGTPTSPCLQTEVMGLGIGPGSYPSSAAVGATGQSVRRDAGEQRRLPLRVERPQRRQQRGCVLGGEVGQEADACRAIEEVASKT